MDKEFRLTIEEVVEPEKVQCHHDIYSQRPDMIPAVRKQYLEVVLTATEWHNLKRSILEIK